LEARFEHLSVKDDGASANKNGYSKHKVYRLHIACAMSPLLMPVLRAPFQLPCPYQVLGSRVS
jgi:hypothetical protein